MPISTVVHSQITRHSFHVMHNCTSVYIFGMMNPQQENSRVGVANMADTGFEEIPLTRQPPLLAVVL